MGQDALSDIRKRYKATWNFYMIMINATTLPNHSFWCSKTVFHIFSLFLKKLTKLNNPISCYYLKAKRCTIDSPPASPGKYLHIQLIYSLNSLNTSTNKWKTWIFHVSKSQTAWLWRRFTKNIWTQWGSHLMMSILMSHKYSQKVFLTNFDYLHMWCQNWKLTSICVNLIMSIYFCEPSLQSSSLTI